MPLRIVALDGIAASIVTGQLTLVGRLGYDEKDGKGTATKEQSIVFFPTKVEPAPSDGKLRNYVNLTLRAGQDADPRYSDAGHFWTRVRMALSQGKDASGNYKPSLWLTVKGFTSKEGDEAVPQALAKLNKGDLATITGRLAYEVSDIQRQGLLQPGGFQGGSSPGCPARSCRRRRLPVLNRIHAALMRQSPSPLMRRAYPARLTLFS